MTSPPAASAGPPAAFPPDAPPAGRPGAIRQRLPYLRLTLPATAATLVAAVGTGAGLRGVAGAVGAAAGVLLVALSYLVSGISVAWADAVHPRLIMPVGLVTYATKFVVLGVVMWLVAATGWAGLAPMGIAIIAAVVVWTGAQLVWAVRAPLPYVRPDVPRTDRNGV